MKNPVADKGLSYTRKGKTRDYDRVFKGSGWSERSVIAQLPKEKLNKQQRYEDFYDRPRWTRRFFGSDPDDRENTGGFRLARTKT